MGRDVIDPGHDAGMDLSDWSAPIFPIAKKMDGQFCRVEPLHVQSHVDDLWAANSEDKADLMWRYLPYGPFENKDAYRVWLEGVCENKDPQWYAILDKQKNQAVGIASYLQIRPEHGCIEVGHLAFSPLLQRTPAATEAMYLMMQYVFKLGYRRYEWKCNALNDKSRAAAQRLGFQFEGIFRQHLVLKGRNRDTAWFSILDGEWSALQACFLQWLSPDNFERTGEQKIHLSRLIKQFSGDHIA